MLPLILAAAAFPPALVEVQSDPWSEALAKLAEKLKAEPGAGVAVMAERLDARTVRLRVKSIGAGFKSIEAIAPEVPGGGGTYAIQANTPQMMDSFDTTTLLPAEALTLKVRIQGEMFSPSLLVPITKAGQKPEPGFVTMGLRTK